MITIEALNCTGMYSFGRVNTIPIDNQGLTFILGVNEDDGGSNGASKSSILNAIKEILFGKNDTGKSGDYVINKHQLWNDGMFGAMWLTDALGQKWRIFNLRKWKGDSSYIGITVPGQPAERSAESTISKLGGKYKGSDVFLERWDEDKWMWVDERPTSDKDKKLQDTFRKIREDILCMTYEQFSAYVCLGQQAESTLVMGSSGSREKIIQAVADVQVWDDAATIIKSSYQEKDNELKLVEAEANGMRTAIESITIPSEDEIEVAEEAVVMATDELKTLEEQIQSKTLKISEAEELAQQLLGGRDLDAEYKELLEQERQYMNEAANTRLSEPGMTEEYKSIQNKIIQIGLKVDITNTDLANYQNVSEGKCSRCGQKVTKEHLQQEIDLCEDEQKEFILQLNNLKIENNKFDVEYLAKCEENKCLAKQEHDHHISKLDEKKEKLESFKKQIADFTSTISIIRNEMAVIGTKKEHQKNIIPTLQQNLDAMKGRVGEQQQLKSQLQEKQTKIETYQIEISHMKWVERNLKRLKLQEYESAINRLNQLMAEYLHHFWRGRINAQFVTASMKSRGTGVKQGLELMVYTPNKEGIPIEMYSGGERKSIVIANFRATRTLMKERGKGVNLAGIDEIDKDLDDSRTDMLVDALETIAEDCSTCLVVSHKTRLLDTMQFNNIWTVRKKNEMANIELTPQSKVEAA